MLVKLTAIQEEVVNFNSAQGHKNYRLLQVFINPQHIVLVKDDIQYVELNIKGALPDGFEKDQKFTRILLSRGNMGEEITAIGDSKGIVSLLNEVKNGR